MREVIVCYRSRPGKLGHVVTANFGATRSSLIFARGYVSDVLDAGAEWAAISLGTVPIKIYRP